jgi:hypothetical protein
VRCVPKNGMNVKQSAKMTKHQDDGDGRNKNLHWRDNGI